MSNKIVPSTYRSVIDDVIENIRPEFEEYGVAEDVLGDLQMRWESKIIASKVAEFESDARQNSNAHDLTSTSQPSIPPLQASFPPPPPPPHPSHYPHPSHFSPSSSHNQYQNNGPLPPISIKTESGEPPRYVPPPPGQPMHLQTYVLPHPLHAHPSTHPGQPPASESVLQFQQRPPPPPASHYTPQSQDLSSQSTATPAPQQSQPNPRRVGGAPPWSSSLDQSRRGDLPLIPQLDGVASTSSNSSNTPPPGAGLPGSSQPKVMGASEEINSDLDDSESEGEGAEETDIGGPDQDIVFCTYDKVARVKNKWKCVLKDGMVHINGKDYLFAKCTGEFEW